MSQDDEIDDLSMASIPDITPTDLDKAYETCRLQIKYELILFILDTFGESIKSSTAKALLNDQNLIPPFANEELISTSHDHSKHLQQSFAIFLTDERSTQWVNWFLAYPTHRETNSALVKSIQGSRETHYGTFFEKHPEPLSYSAIDHDVSKAAEMAIESKKNAFPDENFQNDAKMTTTWKTKAIQTALKNAIIIDSTARFTLIHSRNLVNASNKTTGLDALPENDDLDFIKRKTLLDLALDSFGSNLANSTFVSSLKLPEMPSEDLQESMLQFGSAFEKSLPDNGHWGNLWITALPWKAAASFIHTCFLTTLSYYANDREDKLEEGLVDELMETSFLLLNMTRKGNTTKKRLISGLQTTQEMHAVGSGDTYRRIEKLQRQLNLEKQRKNSKLPRRKK